MPAVYHVVNWRTPATPRDAEVGAPRSPPARIQPWLAVALAKAAILDRRRPLWLLDAVSSSCSCSSSWRSPSRPPGCSSWASRWGGGPQVSSNSTLLLEVSGDLQETEPGGVLGQFLEAPPTVRSIVDALRKASVDRRVSSVIIRPTSNAALWGKVQEVRDAIIDFKRSKKPIVAYLEYGGDQSYYLASACDKVFLMPTASLDLTGMANYELFLRGALDKIGAFPDALHVGDYKTASNTFTEHTFTPAHREMAESLNTDLYEQLIAGLAEGRHRTPAEMRDAHRPRPVPARGRRARRARRRPGLRGRDRRQGRRSGAAAPRRCASRSTAASASSSLGLNRGPRIALIYAVGIISSGASSRFGRRARCSAPTRWSSTCARRAPTTRFAPSCSASTAPADRRSPPTSSGARSC